MAEEKNVPTEWSAEKNVTWKVPLPGAGNSTPIVWEDKMFLTAALADGATGPRDRGTGSPGVALDTRGGGL